MITHKKKFGIYHWDTFDNETILVAEANSLEKAMEIVQKHYGNRIGDNRADQVDIVDKAGNVIQKFSVG